MTIYLTNLNTYYMFFLVKMLRGQMHGENIYSTYSQSFQVGKSSRVDKVPTW
jgi:hypothetical protein